MIMVLRIMVGMEEPTMVGMEEHAHSTLGSVVGAEDIYKCQMNSTSHWENADIFQWLGTW